MPIRAYRDLTKEQLVNLWRDLQWHAKPTILRMDTTPANWLQLDFRGFEDDAGLGSASGIADVNTNWTQDVDDNFRIRFSIDPESGDLVQDFTAQLEYNLASAGWNDVTSSSDVVKVVDDGNTIADGADIGSDATPDGNKIYTGASFDFAFITGEYDDGNGETEETTRPSSSWTEFEFCCQIISGDVTDAQTLQLRITYGANSTDRADEEFASYTNTPTITVNEEAAGLGPAEIITMLNRDKISPIRQM